MFGVPAIEAHAVAGNEVRRVFYVDGYGNDLIVISAVRPRGRAPVLRVDFPGNDRRIAGPLSTRLPVALWRDVEAGTASLTWMQPPRPQDQNGQMSICLHAWVYTLEAARPGIRRVTEDACQDGPGQKFASWLADIAVPLFPHCAALDRKKHRNSASLLRACGMLSGRELTAAAQVMNSVDAFRGIGGDGDAAKLVPYFAPGAAIDWAGDRPAPAEAARYWARHMGPGDGTVAHLYIDRVEGVAMDRVRLTGKLSRSIDTARGRKTGTEHAVVEQLWELQGDGDFRIARATVGQWQAGT